MKCSYLEAARRRTRAAPSKAWSQGTSCEKEQTTRNLSMLSTLSAPQQLSQNVTQQTTLLLSSRHCGDDVNTRRMMAARCASQKRRSQSLGGIHEATAAPQGRRAQTPCVDSQMHTQKRRSQSLGGVHKHMLPSRSDVHRHRVEAATCTPRSEDRNRLVAFTNQILPSRDDVHRHRVVTATCTLRSEDLNRLVAFTRTYAT